MRASPSLPSGILRQKARLPQSFPLAWADLAVDHLRGICTTQRGTFADEAFEADAEMVASTGRTLDAPGPRD